MDKTAERILDPVLDHVQRVEQGGDARAEAENIKIYSY